MLSAKVASFTYGSAQPRVQAAGVLLGYRASPEDARNKQASGAQGQRTPILAKQLGDGLSIGQAIGLWGRRRQGRVLRSTAPAAPGQRTRANTALKPLS